MEELSRGLLPSLWPNGNHSLRALCYGGSIGCEALSLLIALHEFGPVEPSAMRARVLSVDIALAVTGFGVEGRYASEHFAPLFGMEGGLPESLVTRWFTREPNGTAWQPRSVLRDKVDYRTLDLLTEDLGECFELVTCHNVLTHLHPEAATRLLDRLLERAAERAAFVCSGVDLDLKSRITAAGFRPWTARMDEIHDAIATHRKHFRENRGQHYFELEDIDRTRDDWEVRYCTLFYRA